MSVPRRSVLLTGAGAAVLGTGLSDAAQAASARLTGTGTGTGTSMPAPPRAAAGGDLQDRYPDQRSWVREKVAALESLHPGATPLRKVKLPAALAGVSLLVKDESVHPSGSHKHRLA